MYWEKCRRTRLKPRHRGRDLSSSCLKSEQVQRTFSLSFQGRKLKTWSHSSSGSCDAGIASEDLEDFRFMGIARLLPAAWVEICADRGITLLWIHRTVVFTGLHRSGHWDPPIGRFYETEIEPTLQQQAAKFKKRKVIVAGRLFS